MTPKSFADIRADLALRAPTVAAVLEEWMDRVEQQLPSRQPVEKRLHSHKWEVTGVYPHRERECQLCGKTQLGHKSGASDTVVWVTEAKP